MTATTIRVQMAQRKDTAANWTAANPILLSGEIGYETDTEKFKIGDGTTNWNSLAYLPIPDGSGNLTITGNLEIGTTGTLTFEGSTADGFETTLAVTDPTADRTITLPDVSGTVVTTGDTGSVTSTMIADGTIVNADVSATAEIAVSKLANGTANQVLVTDGTDVSWSDDLTLAGNLTVNGTTTTVNTETLVVEDKNIELGVVGTPTDLTADGGGITLKGTTDKTINWVDATDSWTSSEHVDLATGKSYRINGTEVLSSTTLGSGVTGSSLTSVGTISSGTWQGTAIDAAYLDGTVVTTGDTGTVTSTMIADGTIVDGDINASAAIAGTKISPDFGSQNVVTTGTVTGASLNPTSSTVPTNGVYLPAANSVAISTSGTGKLFIDSAGNVGLGSSTPTNALTVQSTARPQLHVSYNGNGGIYLTSANDVARTNWQIASSETTANTLQIYPSDSVGGTTFTTPAVTIDASRRVGVNTTSPGAVLHLAGNADQRFTNTTNTSGFDIGLLAGTGSADSYVFNRANAAVILGTNNSERARIDNSGRLLVGTSASAGNGYRLQVRSDTGGIAEFFTSSAGDSPYLAFSRSRGTAASPTVVASGDRLGTFEFFGYSGAASAFRKGGEISCQVDGEPDTSGDTTDMPGRLVFSTTADGASSPTERLRITSAGVLQIADAGNIAVGTTTGTKIGTATTQKLGFFNKTPVAQPAAVADATDAASVITQLNALLARMRDLGLIAT